MLIRNIGHIFLEIVEKRVVSRKLSGFFFFLDFRCFNYCLSAWHENLPDAPLGRVPSCHLWLPWRRACKSVLSWACWSWKSIGGRTGRGNTPKNIFKFFMVWHFLAIRNRRKNLSIISNVESLIYKTLSLTFGDISEQSATSSIDDITSISRYFPCWYINTHRYVRTTQHCMFGYAVVSSARRLCSVLAGIVSLLSDHPHFVFTSQHPHLQSNLFYFSKLPINAFISTW